MKLRVIPWNDMYFPRGPLELGQFIVNNDEKRYMIPGVQKREK